MKKVYKEIAKEVVTPDDPDFNYALLEKFGDMVVQKCIDIIQKGDYRTVTYTTFDKGYNPRIVQQCIENIKQTFKE